MPGTLPKNGQIVFRTAGNATRVVATVGGGSFTVTSKINTSFFTTVTNAGFVLTSGKAAALFSTISGASFLTTSQINTVFFETPDPNIPRELKLKIGPLTIDSDYTLVDVPDATGNYSASNTGGYNVIPGPYNPFRPYRTNVHLWTVYKVWNVFGNDTQSPSDQNQQDVVPYNYELIFPTTTNADGNEEIIRGVYEIILIAAPFFNENAAGGKYLDDDTGTYYIVEGSEDSVFTELEEDDYLYYVSSSDGELLEINQVDKVFRDTELNLTGAPLNSANPGEKLYGSATAISDMVTAGGEVESYEPLPYYTVSGSLTTFTSGFDYGSYLYYIEPATGDYKGLGRVLEATADTSVNIYDRTENIPDGGEVLCGSGVNLDDVLINSQGTFSEIVDYTITGTDTVFTSFEVGQTLYYQLIDGTLVEIGIIDLIISDTELTITTIPIAPPTLGDRLFASESFIVITPSAGLLNSISGELTSYALTGINTLFQTNFAADDYIYIVSPAGEYNLLGQAGFIPTENLIIFYTSNSIEVNPGDWVWANVATIDLIDLVGTFVEYTTGEFFSVEGDGTTFLDAFEPEQYLFYLDATTVNYYPMGKIFQVYDDTNVWLLEAPEGQFTTDDFLYSSWSLNTQTADYSTYRGATNLYEIAEQYPGWYLTSVGILVDDELINCIVRMRYEFLQQVMCGKCPDEYLQVYGLYVAMINAIDIKEWTSAVTLYNTIKERCATWDSSCGC
jgi:hypothetical protein